MSTETADDDSGPIDGQPNQSATTVLETRLVVPVSDAELAADRLWGAGAQAIEEVGGDGARDRIEFRTVLADTEAVSRSLLGELPSDWQVDFERRSLIPSQTWREYCEPIQVSPRLAIVPAWQADTSTSVEGERLYIEPGSAFGLGDHPTTRLMLEVLDEIEWSGPGVAGRRVLDVGTGTGVLAVAAARYGATVVAIDVAAAAVEATAHNAALNRVRFDVSNTPLTDVESSFDIVLANILAPTLIAMADDLKRVTKSNGRLVISGILADRYQHVVDALAPMVVIEARERDGWAAVVLGWSGAGAELSDGVGPD